MPVVSQRRDDWDVQGRRPRGAAHKAAKVLGDHPNWNSRTVSRGDKSVPQPGDVVLHT
jgi:hypothetical protein